MSIQTDRGRPRCGKRWTAGMMFQCICALDPGHDDDHQCVCGQKHEAAPAEPRRDFLLIENARDSCGGSLLYGCRWYPPCRRHACALDPGHDDDHQCVCGQKHEAAPNAIEFPAAAREAFKVEAEKEKPSACAGGCHVLPSGAVCDCSRFYVCPDHNITGPMVSPEDAKPPHLHTIHPGAREIISRLSGIPGITFQHVDTVQYPEQGRTIATITVWLTDGR